MAHSVPAAVSQQNTFEWRCKHTYSQAWSNADGADEPVLPTIWRLDYCCSTKCCQRAIDERVLHLHRFEDEWEMVRGGDGQSTRRQQNPHEWRAVASRYQSLKKSVRTCVDHHMTECLRQHSECGAYNNEMRAQAGQALVRPHEIELPSVGTVHPANPVFDPEFPELLKAWKNSTPVQFDTIAWQRNDALRVLQTLPLVRLEALGYPRDPLSMWQSEQEREKLELLHAVMNHDARLLMYHTLIDLTERLKLAQLQATRPDWADRWREVQAVIAAQRLQDRQRVQQNELRGYSVRVPFPVNGPGYLLPTLQGESPPPLPLRLQPRILTNREEEDLATAFRSYSHPGRFVVTPGELVGTEQRLEQLNSHLIATDIVRGLGELKPEERGPWLTVRKSNLSQFAQAMDALSHVILEGDLALTLEQGGRLGALCSLNARLSRDHGREVMRWLHGEFESR